MRVERIEVEGGGSVSGVFVFPRDGVGLWIAPSDIGEGALLEAVACALYGPDPWAGDDQTLTRVVLQLRRDDGASIEIDRSLPTGVLEIAGEGAGDLVPEQPGMEFGAQLLQLGRQDFVLACGVRYQDLASTTGHSRLARLLGRAPSAPAEVGQEATAAAATTAPTWTSSATDFAFASPPFETPGGSTGSLSDLDGSRHASTTSTTTRASGEATTVERLRQLRRKLADLEHGLATRSVELHEVSEKREDLQAERTRLGLLADAEPTDLERLSELADLLFAALRRQDELTAEQKAFEQRLPAQNLDLAEIRALEKRFESLTDADRDFLSSAEDATAIRRGNLAITRSECRLDDTRIQEIDRARAGATRLALVPLVVAAAGLFSSLATVLVHAHRLLSGGLLLLGLVGGGTAAGIFWRARTLRQEERETLLETLERKRSQMTTLESESQDVDRRIAQLSGRLGMESARTLRHDWQQWKAASATVQELEGFKKRAAEIEQQVIGIREKIAAFHVGGGSEHEVDAGALQILIDDYRRSFTMRAEIADSDDRAARIEADLTALESERSGVRMCIDAMLVEAGIDPARDVDEAVEMFALRHSQGAPEIADGRATFDAPDGPRVEEPMPSEVVDTSWTPRVSAAAEAILRRFLPEARDLQVDGRLGWTLRLDPRGPRLGPAEFQRISSSALVDQVCLALRLAIVETLSSTRERLPVFLDEPWARADDARHARGMEFLVEDLATRGQVVLRTSHEVRTKWFLHQSPSLRNRVVSVGPFTKDAAPRPPSASFSPSSLS